MVPGNPVDLIIFLEISLYFLSAPNVFGRHYFSYFSGNIPFPEFQGIICLSLDLLRSSWKTRHCFYN